MKIVITKTRPRTDGRWASWGLWMWWADTYERYRSPRLAEHYRLMARRALRGLL